MCVCVCVEREGERKRESESLFVAVLSFVVGQMGDIGRAADKVAAEPEAAVGPRPARPEKRRLTNKPAARGPPPASATSHLRQTVNWCGARVGRADLGQILLKCKQRN